MNPDFQIRQYDIPGVGGPFIETSDGCWVTLTPAPDFRWEPQPEVRSVPLRSISVLLLGTLLGWIGHALIIS